jgi:hypothetical protein
MPGRAQERRRLLHLAAHPEAFGAAPPAQPADTAAGRALVEADRLWGPRRRAGIRVDLAALHAAGQQVAAALAAGRERFGADVLTDTAATREWLWRHLGVLLATDPQTGERTISHRLWAAAIVPPGSEEDWEAWCALRRSAAPAGALTSIRRCLDDESRVHPEIDVYGTITGRMAIRRPALQAVPASLRPLLVADPGQALVGADIHAVEPCVAAWMSGDEHLAADLADGDPYSTLARSVFGAGASPEQRAQAKTALLAQLYGQGVKGLAVRLDIPADQAAEMVDGLRARYRRLFEWLDEVERDKQPTTPWGRRLPVPARQECYLARNWRVQGAAADLFRACCAGAARQLGAEAMWLPVHDELVCQVPAGEADSAARALAAELAPRLGDVQLRAAPTVYGDRWGK